MLPNDIAEAQKLLHLATGTRFLEMSYTRNFTPSFMLTPVEVIEPDEA